MRSRVIQMSRMRQTPFRTLLIVSAILISVVNRAHGESGSGSPPPVPPEVRAVATGAGWRLVDADGMSLYTYERDVTAGVSACDKECASTWPPLLAAKDRTPLPEWSLVTRADGARQWAYKGRPLYRYALDPHPQATVGETVLVAGDFRFNNVGSGSVAPWHAAFEPIPTPPEVRIAATSRGMVLADARSMTLYAFAGKAATSVSACRRECLSDWRPLYAPALAHGFGDWSPVQREDGKRQWAYQGQPLYSFVAEPRAGEIRGEGHTPGGRAVILDGGPARPTWVTVHDSDLGPVLADADGRTLYTAPRDGGWNFEKMLKTTCKRDCVEQHWKPVLVGSSENVEIGNWSAIARDDGSRQWVLEGYPVYVFKDAAPRDVVRGEHYGSGTAQISGFRAVLQSGLVRR